MGKGGRETARLSRPVTPNLLKEVSDVEATRQSNSEGCHPCLSATYTSVWNETGKQWKEK